jgi:predicted DNA-binding transcriptional regulator AlpA
VNAGREWSLADIDRLPPTIDIPVAGSIIGLGRNKAYELVQRGEFPVPVLKLGCRLRVVTAHIRHLVDPPAPPIAGAA